MMGHFHGSLTFSYKYLVITCSIVIIGSALSTVDGHTGHMTDPPFIFFSCQLKNNCINECTKDKSFPALLYGTAQTIGFIKMD